jgi:MinD-like ATPase involved in chromosome partitioning or flagellar assembly
MPAPVVTFYGYKGGVGRSLALANVAVALANLGLKVVMVDLDLESPGLHSFFHAPGAVLPLRNPDIRDWGGALDFIEEWLGLPEFEPQVAPYLHRVHHPQQVSGDLWLMPPAFLNDDYTRRLEVLDWRQLYELDRGQDIVEDLRRKLTDFADVVLIDSRTGMTDIGLICTFQLPDIVVVLFALHQQGIDGAARVAEAVNRRGEALLGEEGGRDRRLILVASRVDETSPVVLDRWLAEARLRFAGLRAELRLGVREYLRHSSELSYGEPIVVGSGAGHEGVKRPYEELATLLLGQSSAQLPPRDQSQLTVLRRLSQGLGPRRADLVSRRADLAIAGPRGLVERLPALQAAALGLDAALVELATLARDLGSPELQSTAERLRGLPAEAWEPEDALRSVRGLVEHIVDERLKSLEEAVLELGTRLLDDERHQARAALLDEGEDSWGSVVAEIESNARDRGIDGRLDAGTLTLAELGLVEPDPSAWPEWLRHRLIGELDRAAGTGQPIPEPRARALGNLVRLAATLSPDRPPEAREWEALRLCGGKDPLAAELADRWWMDGWLRLAPPPMEAVASLAQRWSTEQLRQIAETLRRGLSENATDLTRLIGGRSKDPLVEGAFATFLPEDVELWALAVLARQGAAHALEGFVWALLLRGRVEDVLPLIDVLPRDAQDLASAYAHATLNRPIDSGPWETFRSKTVDARAQSGLSELVGRARKTINAITVFGGWPPGEFYRDHMRDLWKSRLELLLDRQLPEMDLKGVFGKPVTVEHFMQWSYDKQKAAGHRTSLPKDTARTNIQDRWRDVEAVLVQISRHRLPVPMTLRQALSPAEPVAPELPHGARTGQIAVHHALLNHLVHDSTLPPAVAPVPGFLFSEQAREEPLSRSLTLAEIISGLRTPHTVGQSLLAERRFNELAHIMSTSPTLPWGDLAEALRYQVQVWRDGQVEILSILEAEAAPFSADPILQEQLIEARRLLEGSAGAPSLAHQQALREAIEWARIVLDEVEKAERIRQEARRSAATVARKALLSWMDDRSLEVDGWDNPAMRRRAVELWRTADVEGLRSLLDQIQANPDCSPVGFPEALVGVVTPLQPARSEAPAAHAALWPSSAAVVESTRVRDLPDWADEAPARCWSREELARRAASIKEGPSPAPGDSLRLHRRHALHLSVEARLACLRGEPAQALPLWVDAWAIGLRSGQPRLWLLDCVAGFLLSLLDQAQPERDRRWDEELRRPLRRGYLHDIDRAGLFPQLAAAIAHLGPQAGLDLLVQHLLPLIDGDTILLIGLAEALALAHSLVVVRPLLVALARPCDPELAEALAKVEPGESPQEHLRRQVIAREEMSTFAGAVAQALRSRHPSRGLRDLLSELRLSPHREVWLPDRAELGAQARVAFRLELPAGLPISTFRLDGALYSPAGIDLSASHHMELLGPALSRFSGSATEQREIVLSFPVDPRTIEGEMSYEPRVEATLLGALRPETHRPVGRLTLRAHRHPLSVQATNPYSSGAPTDKPVGRRAELDRLCHSLFGVDRDNLVIVHADRRMGKTSFLNALMNDQRVRRRYLNTLHVDGESLKGGSGETDLLLRCVYRLHELLQRDRRLLDLPSVKGDRFRADPADAFERWMKQLDLTLSNQNQRVLVLIEELERWLEVSTATPQGTQVVAALRSVIQDCRRVGFVLAGVSDAILAHTRRKEDRLFRAGDLIELKKLNEEATRELASTRASAHYDMSPLAADRIHQHTLGHPWFAQALCFRLFRRATSKNLRLAVVADVDAVADELLTEPHLFHDLTSRLSDERLKLLRSVARIQRLDGYVPAADLARRLNRPGTEGEDRTLLELQEIEEVVPALLTSRVGVLRRASKRIEPPLFARYLRMRE